MTDEGTHLRSLLEPSLQAGVAPRSLYSPQACFFVAFLGGPFAILLFGAMNSKRLDRLAQDAWVFGLGAVAAVAFVAVVGQVVSGGAVPEWLSVLGEGNRGVRNASRVLALLLFALVYLRNRPFYKAAELRGLASPNPWIPGLVATAAGFALSLAVIAVFVGVTR